MTRWLIRLVILLLAAVGARLIHERFSQRRDRDLDRLRATWPPHAWPE